MFRGVNNVLLLAIVFNSAERFVRGGHQILDDLVGFGKRDPFGIARLYT
jgi:hypothetical protein